MFQAENTPKHTEKLEIYTHAQAHACYFFSAFNFTRTRVFRRAPVLEEGTADRLERIGARTRASHLLVLQVVEHALRNGSTDGEALWWIQGRTETRARGDACSMLVASRTAHLRKSMRHRTQGSGH